MGGRKWYQMPFSHLSRCDKFKFACSVDFNFFKRKCSLQGCIRSSIRHPIPSYLKSYMLNSLQHTQYSLKNDQEQLTVLTVILISFFSPHSERWPRSTSFCRKQLRVKPMLKCVFSSSSRSCWTGPTVLRNSSRSSAAVPPPPTAAWDTAVCRDPNLMDDRYSN